MSMKLSGSAAAEWKLSWPVVLAGMVGLCVSIMLFHSIGIMIAPLEKEFGWTRAQISIGPSIVSTVGFLSGPFVGMAIDRLGSRRIALFGVLFFCGAMAMLSLAGPSIWSWWALWCLVALAHPFVKPNVWVAAVSSLFASSRGMALAVLLCGTGIGGTITPQVGNYLIEHYSWRVAYMGIAAMWAAIGFPLVFFLFFSARDQHRLGLTKAAAAATEKAKDLVLTGLTWREGLFSWKFFKLLIGSSVLSLAAASIAINTVPILTWNGFTPGVAAFIYGFAGMSSVAGRLIGGYLIDRIDAALVVAVSAVLPAICAILLLMVPGSMVVATLAIVILGFSIGIELDGVAYLVSRHFGMLNFGVIFGTVAGFIAFCSSLGPIISNFVYDQTHSYESYLWAVIPVALLSGAMFMLLGKYPDFETPRTEEAAS